MAICLMAAILNSLARPPGGIHMLVNQVFGNLIPLPNTMQSYKKSARNAFRNIGKKTAWKTWEEMPSITQTFLAMKEIQAQLGGALIFFSLPLPGMM